MTLTRFVATLKVSGALQLENMREVWNQEEDDKQEQGREGEQEARVKSVARDNLLGYKTSRHPAATLWAGSVWEPAVSL